MPILVRQASKKAEAEPLVRVLRNRVRRRVFAMTLVAFCVLLAGCESVPGKTIRGARLYASGSDALERGDSSRAIVDLEAAARLVPQGSEIQNHLGLAYWAEGRSDRARLAFERALVLDCDNGPARRNLERLEATTGRVGTIESDVANGGTDHGG